MGRAARRTMLTLLLLSLAAPVRGRTTISMPAPAARRDGGTGERHPGPRDRDPQGDTLYGISRGSAAGVPTSPRFCWFNDIKNPHQIHDGELLRCRDRKRPATRHKALPRRNRLSAGPRPPPRRYPPPLPRRSQTATRPPAELPGRSEEIAVTAKKPARSGRATKGKSRSSASTDAPLLPGNSSTAPWPPSIGVSGVRL